MRLVQLVSLVLLCALAMSALFVVAPSHEQEVQQCLDEQVVRCSSDSECIEQAYEGCGQLLEDDEFFGPFGLE